LLYLLWHSKFEGKEMCPIFVFAKCCWSFHSKVAWQAYAQQTEKSLCHTTSAVSRQVLCGCPSVSSASIDCIFQHMICYDPTSERV